MIVYLFLSRLRLAFAQSDGKSLSASTRGAPTDSTRSNHVQSANSSFQIPQAFAQRALEHPDGRQPCRIRPSEKAGEAGTVRCSQRPEARRAEISSG